MCSLNILSVKKKLKIWWSSLLPIFHFPDFTPQALLPQTLLIDFIPQTLPTPADITPRFYLKNWWSFTSQISLPRLYSLKLNSPDFTPQTLFPRLYSLRLYYLRLNSLDFTPQALFPRLYS